MPAPTELDGVERTAPAVIRAAAEKFGEKPLLVMVDSRLSFRDLAEQSAQLAKHLLSLGLGKGSRIGLQFSYSPEFLVAFAAAWRIGAVAAPLSTAYTPVEMRQAVRRADIDTLIVAADVVHRDELAFLTEALPELESASSEAPYLFAELPFLRRVQVLGESGDVPQWAANVDLEAAGTALPEALLEAVESEVSPADIGVLIQTSGSTAEPKGVLHTQGAMFGKTRGGAIGGPLFLGMPFFWVGGLLVLSGALEAGSTMLCQVRNNPGEALDLIERERAIAVAGWLTLVPQLRAHPSLAGRDLSSIPMLTDEPTERPYMVGLGMTESFGPHMAMPIERFGMDPPDHLRGTNGVTAPNYEHLLVDPTSGEVIEGDGEGEIWIRGPFVMAGMYKREREDVFEPGGWYATGDRVRREDDCWFFTGRTTEMIKTRGSNVAPPEVEAVIESQAGVKHCFVIGLHHDQWGEQVAAVVVPDETLQLQVDEIRAAAAEQLSGYKVPSVLLILHEDDVIWLGTGKPDKRAMRPMLEALT
jgi:acyl-CoA synthetase (AMP-forming)/AMP-acid ligase II